MKGTDLSDISSIMDGESDNSMNVSSSMPMNTDKFQYHKFDSRAFGSKGSRMMAWRLFSKINLLALRTLLKITFLKICFLVFKVDWLRERHLSIFMTKNLALDNLIHLLKRKKLIRMQILRSLNLMFNRTTH
jgi:hypothetical protein